MNKRETIKDFYGKIIGFVETDNQGNKRVTDRYGRYCGTYYKRLNQTKNRYGRIVAIGDNIGLLLTAQ